MFRVKNLYLKIILLLILFCTFVTYLIKNRYLSNDSDKFDYFADDNGNINDELRNKENYHIEIIYNLNNIGANQTDPLLNLVATEDELQDDLNYLLDHKKQSEYLINKNDYEPYKLIQKNKRVLKSNEPNSNNKSGPNAYLILEYTKVFSQPKFCSKTASQIFNSEIEKCEYSNCLYTCDKSRLKDADALLFHQRDLETEFQYKYVNSYTNWIENTQQIPFKTVSEKLKNNPDQNWILWNDEATYVNREFNKMSELFNWTLSYKTDAEIFEGSYGFFKYNYNMDKEKLLKLKKEIYRSHFKRRKNAILWFVSNCESKIRIKTALELSKYYPVYIYGKCDPLDGMSQFERKKKYPFLRVTNFIESKISCEPGSECEEIKLKTFKYYLAFENRNCSDYLTEKVWRSLNKNMIPIILQPNSDSYVRYSIPFKSFIHLQNFNFDVKKLGSYLNSMDSDFKMYYAHLKWTYVYMNTVYDGKYTEPHRLCQLCKKLNTYTSRINYIKIADFFNDKCNS